ncbi:beta-lactamase domain protein [hydrothermal vent metagenome]|uniref:Beta-lactamase domain protein n=1 Tax=hydrothermal vent metagenome TaxID=652676 RepID=A0A1W1BV17_9ZZZZ
MIEINKKYDLTKDAVLLLEDGQHKIYWVGTTSSKALRSNIYLIKDRNEGIIIDCGSRGQFQETLERIKQVMPISYITRIFANHQDPDVTSAMADWLKLNPNIEIIASPSTNTLIEHYLPDGETYNYFNTERSPTLTLDSGAVLEFIPSPFMHFAGAVSVYDRHTKTLFSGDIWAAISLEWKLILEDDFDEHIENMDFFHQGYIGSNKAARNFLINFKDKEVKHIMPQHGSIILEENVNKAFSYLKNLKCGMDYYPNITDDDLSFIE